tara:strand:+ start:5913 stop:6509 length:597 start_codon:yes stop_codon:yes gene_type:complete
MLTESKNPNLNHQPGHIKHDGHNMTGFIIFLCSESIIFFAFFVGYGVLKITSPVWYPEGVNGIEVKMPFINTIILVSSSFVIYFAEKCLHKKNLWGFRSIWLLTMLMGSYFVYGQYLEWSELSFSLQSGVFGGMFYLLTGFHGLHVITGILLMSLMLFRSFIPNNYLKGEMGVESVSLFWHFVDVIWIILFGLIYLWQ